MADKNKKKTADNTIKSDSVLYEIQPRALENAQYPAPLLANPIFFPEPKRKPKDTDESKHTKIEFPYHNGVMKLIGPFLSTSHEDTLIGLLQAMDKLSGPSEEGSQALGVLSNLPQLTKSEQSQLIVSFIDGLNSTPGKESAGTKSQTMLFADISIASISEYIGNAWGSGTRELIHRHLWDLKNTKIIYSEPGKIDIESNMLELYGDVNLSNRFRVEIKGLFLGLVLDYKRIDMKLRFLLNPTGRALHRHLSSLGFPAPGLRAELTEGDLQVLFKSTSPFRKILARLKRLDPTAEEKAQGKLGKDGALEVMKKDGFIKEYKDTRCNRYTEKKVRKLVITS